MTRGGRSTYRLISCAALRLSRRTRTDHDRRGKVRRQVARWARWGCRMSAIRTAPRSLSSESGFRSTPACGDPRAAWNPTPLSDPRARRIDYVLVRESTEGLFTGRRLTRRDGNAAVCAVGRYRRRACRVPALPRHGTRHCRARPRQSDGDVFVGRNDARLAGRSARRRCVRPSRRRVDSGRRAGIR